MVNNLSGRMKQLYKNLESISGLKTECFHLVLQYFPVFCPIVLLKLELLSNDTSQAKSGKLL